MGKKLRNVMLHMIGTVMTVSLMFGNALCVFAEETKSEETVTAVSDAEMTPNSEKLVSQKAPEVFHNRVIVAITFSRHTLKNSFFS